MTPEVATPVPLHLLEVRVPIWTGSHSAKNWDLVAEIGDRFGIVDVVVAAVIAIAILQDSATCAGLRSNVLDHRHRGGLIQRSPGDIEGVGTTSCP